MTPSSPGSSPHTANVHKWFGMQSTAAQGSLTLTEMFYIELKLTYTHGPVTVGHST